MLANLRVGFDWKPPKNNTIVNYYILSFLTGQTQFRAKTVDLAIVKASSRVIEC